MMRAFALSLEQLTDPAVLRILFKSLLITLVLFVLLGVGLSTFLAGADPCSLAGGTCPLGSMESGFAAFMLTMLALWFLFPAVAVGVVALFMDEVIEAVERRHYPEMSGSIRHSGIMAGMATGLKSSLRLLLYNLVALPFYILLLVTGIGPLILFLVVNGAALGRDLAEMVASRHLDRQARKRWIAEARGPRIAMGLTAAILFLIPLVNLIAPVLATAMATHIFHLRTSARAPFLRENP